MPTYRAVVTDLDNTLYSWVDYIVPSLEAMVASLMETTGRPRIAYYDGVNSSVLYYAWSNASPLTAAATIGFTGDFSSFSR